MNHCWHLFFRSEVNFVRAERNKFELEIGFAKEKLDSFMKEFEQQVNFIRLSAGWWFRLYLFAYLHLFIQIESRNEWRVSSKCRVLTTYCRLPKKTAGSFRIPAQCWWTVPEIEYWGKTLCIIIKRGLLPFSSRTSVF